MPDEELITALADVAKAQSLDPIMEVTVVPRLADAQWAYCATCETALASPYCGLDKSKAMHQRGTGHKVVYLALAGEQASPPAAFPEPGTFTMLAGSLPLVIGAA
jgi:hypothetical protein